MVFFISSHVISVHLISSHLISSHHISSHLISFHFISSQLCHSIHTERILIYIRTFSVEYPTTFRPPLLFDRDKIFEKFIINVL